MNQEEIEAKKEIIRSETVKAFTAPEIQDFVAKYFAGVVQLKFSQPFTDEDRIVLSCIAEDFLLELLERVGVSSKEGHDE